MASKGIKSDFLDDEADCSDDDDDENEISSVSDVSDLIDNAECVQGNSLELFAQQQAAFYEQQITAVKRKLKMPRKPLQPLSSQTNFAGNKPSLKRTRLDDSGYAEDDSEKVVQVQSSSLIDSEGYGSLATQESLRANKENQEAVKLLQRSNALAVKLAKFKEVYLVSYCSLTRPFKSDKTCCRHWVTAVFGANEDLLEASKKLLQKHCDYILYAERTCSLGFVGLYLLEFKSAKNRDTVKRLFKELLSVEDEQLLLEPPKLKSVPAAVYWWKAGISAFTWGTPPEWVAHQTSVTHQQNEEAPFNLSVMVQWAYDHNFIEESQIAYNYAKLAYEDANAAAFLKCNNQVKHVKECCQMVRYYKTGEMREMTIGQWIKKSINEMEEGGNWKNIVLFLKYQEISFISFMIKFKDFLHGVPKKNCLVIIGPPNSGKSMFAMSLMRALKGRVLSFVNSKSHFWLQPLQSAKVAVLDDATKPTWDYFDTYLRNGLDGNPVSLDLKHRAPIQINFPPLLITSNVDVLAESSLFYLHSRIQVLYFNNTFPFKENGEPVFLINELSWKSFFTRLWEQLDLTDPAEEDGHPGSPFRCTAR
ncbi:E1 early protein [Bos taurus papillomavirus 40]|nr:E1 early protein [Bos taurus papillomavirus 40]